MKQALALALLLASATLCPGQTASGMLTQNGKTIRLKSAVAVWDAAAGRLTIALLPFAVSRKDIDTIRDSGALFVAADKPSPNPARWPKPPFAVLVIEFRNAAGMIRPENVRHYELHVSWLDRMNYTLSVNRNYQDEVKREFSELAGSPRAGATVRLVGHGNQTFRGGDKLSWDFRVNSEIYPKK